MKNTILTLLIAITILNANSQDVITKKDGTDINVKVKEITIDAVKYLNFDNQNGPLYTISKTDVFRIKYENGEVDSFVITNTTTQTKSLTELENKVALIIYNNDNHHIQYNLGRWFSFAGQIAVIVGSITLSPELLIGGGVASIIGFVVEWDSHKWFSRGNNIINNHSFIESKLNFNTLGVLDNNISQYVEKDADGIYSFEDFFDGMYIVVDSQENGIIYCRVIKRKNKILVVQNLVFNEKINFWYSDIKKARLMNQNDIKLINNE